MLKTSHSCAINGLMLCKSKEWELKNEFLSLLQDNQIALRTAYLEEENSNLRDQFESLSNVNQEMRKSVEELKSTLRAIQHQQKERMQVETGHQQK